MRFLRCLLLGTLLSALAVPDTLAQPVPPAATSSAMTDKARQLFVEGSQLFREKKWPQAEASFEAAWALEKHYSIAANLAETKLRLGKHRAAAELLVFALGHAPASDNAERKHGEDLLAQAKAKIGTLTIRVQPADATVTVGDRTLTSAALSDPVFVDPGQVIVTARKDGHQPATKTVDAAAGATLQVDLAPVPVVVPPSSATASASATAVPSVTAIATTLPTSPAGPRKEVLIGGAVLAGASAITGAVLLGVASASGADATRLLTAVQIKSDQCAGQETACNAVRDKLRMQDTLVDAGIGMFVVAGIAGLLTGGYWALNRSTSVRTAFVLSPVVIPGAGGVVAKGNW
jgi:hypothetical protein